MTYASEEAVAEALHKLETKISAKAMANRVSIQLLMQIVSRVAENDMSKVMADALRATSDKFVMMADGNPDFWEIFAEEIRDLAEAIDPEG